MHVYNFIYICSGSAMTLCQQDGKYVSYMYIQFVLRLFCGEGLHVGAQLQEETDQGARPLHRKQKYFHYV